MNVHTGHGTFVCPICDTTKPTRTALHGEMIRPAIADLIRREHPAWATTDLVCSDCLNHYRAEYIEDVLEEERGEVSRIERDVLDSLRERELLSADLNTAFDAKLTLGQRVADRVATFGGSWVFIGSFGLVLVVWLAINSMGMLRRPFDPFPCILLNLVLSCLAAIQAPIIMMSQNRVEARDRLRADNDYRVNLKAELEIRHLTEKMDLLLSQQWQRLLEIQRIQVDLMEELTRKKP